MNLSISAVPASLDDNRVLRIFTIFLLYAGQGVPIGLFDFAIPGWMAINGAEASEIGFVVALAGLPWSFKFLNGFIMDRYTILSMGRRRAWIISAQIIIVGSLVTFALVDPGPRDYVLLGLIAFIVNASVTFQDVAVDGLTIDILPESERSFGGAVMGGGQSLGIAASATFTGTLIYIYGASAAYLACAFLVGLVTVHILWVRERNGERRLPWSNGNAHPRNEKLHAKSWIEIFGGTFKAVLSRESLIWLPIPFGRGFIYGTMIVAIPLIASQYAGWSEDRLGSVNGSGNFIAGIVALTIGSIFVLKIGAQRAISLCIALFLAFIAWVLFAMPQWSDPKLMTAFIVGWLILYALLGVAIMVISMRFCSPKVAATQFSIYMAVHNLGITFAGLLIGTLAYLSTPVAMLQTLLGILLALLVLVIVARYPDRQVPTADDPEARATHDR